MGWGGGGCKTDRIRNAISETSRAGWQSSKDLILLGSNRDLGKKMKLTIGAAAKGQRFPRRNNVKLVFSGDGSRERERERERGRG